MLIFRVWETCSINFVFGVITTDLGHKLFHTFIELKNTDHAILLMSYLWSLAICFVNSNKSPSAQILDSSWDFKTQPYLAKWKFLSCVFWTSDVRILWPSNYNIEKLILSAKLGDENICIYRNFRGCDNLLAYWAYKRKLSRRSS